MESAFTALLFTQGMNEAGLYDIVGATYVASGMTGIPYFTIARFVLPYLIALTIAWMIIAFWPPLSTFLVQYGGS